MASHREIERTYDPAPDADLPDLSGLPGVVGVGGTRVDLLRADYFDTHDLALARAGVSLRRRTGGADEGWHLKTPAGADRDELQLPLDRAVRTPPKALREAALGWTRGSLLAVVATIETRRTTCTLHGEDGRVLAELADDAVTGTRVDGTVVSWREWELELVDGDPGLLDDADDLLAAAGVGRAEVPRKIARVLGEALPAAATLRAAKPGKPAARVVHRRLADQVAELARRDVQIRRGQQEGVHKARIACRRLRSLLATYRPVLDREVTDPVRDEIQWLARSLSDARDAVVVSARLLSLLGEEPAGLVIGPVERRVRTTYGKRARAGLSEVLGSQRYFALRDSLDRLVAEPPWTEEAGRPAREVLLRPVHRDWRRVRRRYVAVGDADDRDVALHEVRKAAKRLRYAAETVEPVVGEDARRLASAANELTSYLGERQDSVVCRGEIVALAAAAVADGESSFTYGRLHAREQQRATELDARLDAAWHRVARPRLRAWLR